MTVPGPVTRAGGMGTTTPAGSLGVGLPCPLRALGDDTLRDDMLGDDMLRDDMLRDGMLRDDMLRDGMLRGDTVADMFKASPSGRLVLAALVLVSSLPLVACGRGGPSTISTTSQVAPTEPGASGEIYVGLPLEEAEALGRERGFATRVVSVDDVELIVTMDYSERRLNFEVVDGTVKAVTRG